MRKKYAYWALSMSYNKALTFDFKKFDTPNATNTEIQAIDTVRNLVAEETNNEKLIKRAKKINFALQNTSYKKLLTRHKKLLKQISKQSDKEIVKNALRQIENMALNEATIALTGKNIIELLDALSDTAKKKLENIFMQPFMELLKTQTEIESFNKYGITITVPKSFLLPETQHTIISSIRSRLSSAYDNITAKPTNGELSEYIAERTVTNDNNDDSYFHVQLNTLNKLQILKDILTIYQIQNN